MTSNASIKWNIISLSIIRGLMAFALVNAAEEECREELTLCPLIDGKVFALISTLLHGAVPRSPSILVTDDTRTPARITFLPLASA